jgi:Trp operon repressor
MKTNNFDTREEWINFVWKKLLENINNSKITGILDSLLSRYEKKMIVNRIIALSLIKKGKSYKQISEELWLSPNTIRSLRIIFQNKLVKDYRGYNFRTNEKKKLKEKIESQNPKYYPEPSPFFDWIDYFISSLPKRNGPRWKNFPK